MEVYTETPIAAMPQENNELTRRSANFQPSIWGEHFLAYATDDVNENVFQEDSEVEELKEEIRKMQIGTPDKSKQKMELTDTIQRLGVSYHFENATEALLLCDVFNKFKNPEGEFKESLVSNVRRMLSLYEAAYFGIHGENVLEEALKFTTNNL
ncbi:hypothetical protein ACH5RR_037822 [Cinchona calisaya]|uniref:Terpene synthase N-terminal domain-containing protein n=1 Tax=Cinchona calisaya TaxID=153742 RepID=A0ABD2YCT4_9GENT